MNFEEHAAKSLVLSPAGIPVPRGILCISPAEAAMELLANTVAVRRNPGLSLALIQRAVSAGSAIKGTRGDAAAAVPRLLQLCDGEAKSLRVRPAGKIAVRPGKLARPARRDAS